MTDDGLRGRVLLVTGSGRGIGAAVARAAGALGARVAANCRRDPSALEAVAADIERHGGESLCARADVCAPDEARSLVERVLARWGRIDVLVNTVGEFHWDGLVDLDAETWRRVMASNLDSVFHMCRLTIPHMRRQRFGRIVNFAAVGAASSHGEPQRAAYSAAKAAVVALSRALALEEARAGITVNVVAPGLLRDDPAVGGPSGEALADRVPVGHAGVAADVVRAVMFFASPAAEFVTGQVLEVAGGARN